MAMNEVTRVWLREQHFAPYSTKRNNLRGLQSAAAIARSKLGACKRQIDLHGASVADLVQEKASLRKEQNELLENLDEERTKSEHRNTQWGKQVKEYKQEINKVDKQLEKVSVFYDRWDVH